MISKKKTATDLYLGGSPLTVRGNAKGVLGEKKTKIEKRNTVNNIKRNMDKLLICILFINRFSQTSTVEFISAPTREIAKLGEKLAINYYLSETKGIRLERVYNQTYKNIYETPNFNSYYENRWKVTPSGESSSYSFINNNVQEIDGFTINATIMDENSTDSRITAIVIYDSNPRLLTYPRNTLMEGEKFNVYCNFDIWGSAHISFEVFMNDKQLNSNAIIVFSDGLVTLKSSIIATPEMNNQNLYCQVKLFRSTDDVFSAFESEKSEKLNIEYKVRDIKLASNFSKSDSQAKTGDEIACSATGNPIPKYEWREASSSAILTTNSKLIIKEEWQGKKYFVCTAWNIVDGERNSITERISLTIPESELDCKDRKVMISDPVKFPNNKFSQYRQYYLDRGHLMRLTPGTNAFLCGNPNTCWVQVDLTDVYIIHGFDMRGGRGKYTTTFKVGYGISSVQWMRDNSSNTLIFHGNTDANKYSILHHELPNPVETRYFRIFPITGADRPAVAVELYGCRCGTLQLAKKQKNGIQ
ncbi:DgyrCDS14401 [Dimorphilus gyrociliatus]|uniref:DgyrCDS14401 n=1 Tax=Dimorphilus gyrociliatus TaxID=2664684 RepID=A0A7I8WDH4_9ANNE|nr:DgyrCDS14401 [Dimorphilus gyrociliatus]